MGLHGWWVVAVDNVGARKVVSNHGVCMRGTDLQVHVEVAGRNTIQDICLGVRSMEVGRLAWSEAYQL